MYCHVLGSLLSILISAHSVILSISTKVLMKFSIPSISKENAIWGVIDKIIIALISAISRVKLIPTTQSVPKELEFLLSHKIILSLS